MTAGVARRRFRLPLCRPLRTSQGSIDVREGFALALRTEWGIGVGEATPLPGWTETIEQTEAALPTGDADDTHHWARPLPPERPAARHAIQLAVADLAAQRADQPLATYLRGDDALNRVAVNATVGKASPEETVERVRAAAEAGFETIKVKVGGGSLTETIERIERLADLTGDVTLRLDANGAWDVDRARRVLATAGSAGIQLIEEPLADPTPEMLARLEDTGVEIALDETLLQDTAVDRDDWLDVVDVVVIKPMAVGGLDRSIELAERARAGDVAVIISNTVDGVIGRAAAVHLAAALRCDRAAGLATGDRLDVDLAEDIVPVKNGEIVVPQGPGVGTLGPWDRTAQGGTTS